jgi:hypothetical protein
MEKLKPCKCGNDADVVRQDNHYYGELNGYWVQCRVCPATGPMRKTIQEAVIAWNRRAGERKEDR